MMKKYLMFLVLISAIGSTKGQPGVILSGDRLGEDELSLESMYIAAYQQKMLEKYDGALKLYAQILEQNEVIASVHHDMAQIYKATEDYEKAVSSAKKAVRYDPENLWYLITLTEIYEVIDAYEDAANTLSEVIKKSPTANYYHRKAHNQELANKKVEAIVTYDIADRKFGWDTFRSDSRAALYMSLGKEKEAINEVKKWTERDPKNSDSWIKLARFYEFTGAHKKSQKTYEHILSLEPDNEEAIVKSKDSNGHKNVASELSSFINDPRIGIDNKIKSLIPHLDNKDQKNDLLLLSESLIEQYPENAKTYALKGDILWLKGETTLAIPQYEKSLTLNKSVYEVWDQLMMALSLDKRYERLLNLSKDAQNYYPNQAGPYYFNGLALFGLGRMEEAEKINEEAVFIAGITGGYIAEQSIILKATIFDASGNTEAAIKTIETLNASSITAGIQELLGDLHFKLGNKVAAEKAWKESINLGGNKDRLGLKIQSI